MSRFGLRSNSEVSTLPDDWNNRKSARTTKTPLKKILHKKKQGVDFAGKKDGPSSEKEKIGPAVSIICSLPLTRLAGFLEKLKIEKKCLSLPTHHNGGAAAICNKNKKDDRNDLQMISTEHTINSKKEIHDECQESQKQPIRILCLYCDKKFTSYKMQLNHVEKFHIQQKNRRSSGRNSQIVSTLKKRDELFGIKTEKYPGCAYCKRTKSHQIIASAKELNGLFLHLVDFHADKYFGCKECVQRFQNITKLSKHMQTVHKSVKFSLEDINKTNNEEVKSAEQIEDVKNTTEKSKVIKTRSVKIQKSSLSVNTLIEDINPLNSNTIIGGEEPILSRLGLTQNRLPNNRKCLRVRKENTLSDVILKSDAPVYTSAVKARNKSGKNVIREIGDADIVFRMPSRTEVLSCVFDEHFYREVVSNVRHNLLYYLDGNLKNNTASAINIEKTAAIKTHQLPTIRSTLVESSVVLSSSVNSEIHAATNLTATTAFPTLLTAEQYGGDVISSKIRRPHTKNSWKWKWDSVKKFKIINEGGKIIKKMKQPISGLRDLSKLDMWTQLIMRQKHEIHQQSIGSKLLSSEITVGNTREEKQRLNDQLNLILDMRLLPRIILEQNEQAIIKVEHDSDFTSYVQNSEGDNTDNILGHSFIDDEFLSVLNLHPNYEPRCSRRQLVLSGEWARPRCYLCMCCGAKFDKLKTLEEHKMFRHSHVLCTHYEVVGRELLAGNLIRHFFIPNRALSYYGNEGYNFSNFSRKYNYYKDGTVDLSRRLVTGSTGEDDSSDSVQSTVNSCTMNTYSIKNSADECDTDTKITLDINTVSPSHSMQSSNCSFTLPMKMHTKTKEKGSTNTKCSKCSRKCSGILDLYRHMLDCSGDYIWSLAKKRKYRYYCGSKKRRSWNKHNFTELRKTKPKCLKPSLPANDTEESVSSSSKTKTPPRQRPSDAESIKKMLENLPPKRVCKTIFPPLPKAKKSKFLAKHKIFNSQGRMLRKTHARQIPTLSKSKSQFSNKVTRSKSKKSDQKANKDDHLNVCDEEQVVKEDKLPESVVKPVCLPLEILKSPKENSVQINVSSQNCMNNSKKESSLSIIETSANISTEESPKLAIEQENFLRKEQFHYPLLEKDAQNDKIQIQGPICETKSDAEVILNSENLNCNKKKSKRINDCIAMLTGKLEEKLKTERNGSKRDKPSYGMDKVDVSTEKGANVLKPPKRKTVSRRIIKVDNVDINTSMLIPEDLQDDANISSISKELNTPESLLQNPTALLTKEPKPLSTDTNVLPTPSSIAHAVFVPNPDKMFAKLPVFKPIDKIVDIIPTPESLTCSTLPVAPPVQNVLVNMSNLHPQIPVLPPQPLLAPQIAITPVIVPVAPMAPIVPVAPLFSSEPLNLSNTKNVKKYNVSQDLSGSAPFRSGIPARRQTICGFEARNIFLNDEPLDLSQKSKKEQPHIEPKEIHPVIPFFKPAVTAVVNNMSMPPPPNMNINKQFYSNLELLRIPQVRNPVNKKCSEQPVSQIPKNIIKKRSVCKSNLEKNTQSPIVTTSIKSLNKEFPLQKKDNSNKLKQAPKMDDEVINHIDDAINSVINAVKASLPDNEDEDQRFKESTEIFEHSENSIKISSSAEKSQKTQECNEGTTKEALPIVQQTLKFLPQKRSTRSKTLDCRPTTIKVAEVFPNVSQHNDTPLESKEIADAENSNTVTVSEVVPALDISMKNNLREDHNKSLQTNLNKDYVRKTSLKTIQQPLNLKESIISKSLKAPCEEKSKESYTRESEDRISAKKSLDENNDNLASEENISNINNTSSGFHSSGQIEATLEGKKKQRRRRKNELAAIVADQLLESFKIDKTRRDNLKKLENLAYEKSEDLLLTGMLLMSSTKRNATSSAKRDVRNTDVNKGTENYSKRQKPNTALSSKPNNEQPRGNNNAAVKSAKKEENIAEDCPLGKQISFKRNRRRTYRSKGKSFDNENISKLKSSLESFSIGIEKQLSELEARNSNVFNFAEKNSYSASSVLTRSSLLKPSILCTNPDPSHENKVKVVESKSAIFSRDPRLNKNIHKNENHGLGNSKSIANLDEICDAEDDNYLKEIAKNVNEKIMSAEDEEFAFGNDSFVMGNELQDDSNSKCYSRPPTSMSVRSAPSFNDDRSNFGSICDENTNTEVMDMDLEDELSVYTSYSQDIGRNRGRRKRRRRSILLKRRPKKRINRDTCTEKFDCNLCKKTFFTVNSLTKHNMTLAHVSNVSAQEYLLSKSLHNSPAQINCNKESLSTETCTNNIKKGNGLSSNLNVVLVAESPNNLDKHTSIGEKHKLDEKEKSTYNNSSRLTLNPDERLFFECCNILKGTEATAVNNDDCNTSGGYPFYGNKNHQSTNHANVKSIKGDLHSPKKNTTLTSPYQNVDQNIFRSPPAIHSTSKNVVPVITSQIQRLSPNYSGVSQFSAVTNTTSRFKTKAAMKGYENMNVDLSVYQESTKTRTICKLTELAEIALGNEKTNSPEFDSSPNNNDGTILKPLSDREYVTLSVINHQKDYSAQTDRVKNNETQSSTSSKTIMHSSIIKAAVEEHNKMSHGKIVIPERPFKNIGLEEKETITFQKPKTSINLLRDDNSISTTSYSDRDDFDFASISCDEDSNAKGSNERNIEHNSESSSSRATAKTFENKSLIMGRIFKNASTKAKNSLIIQNIGVQNDAQQKTDMNQLFDELRGDFIVKSNTSENIVKNKLADTSKNLQSNQTTIGSDRTTSRLSKEVRKKSNTNKKPHKDISRLESELGMSQEEIVKLINEGQRKSKRRCATNQQKKLVEMWSSDEYEEFLSTKDIIALIEEKEKQERGRKRRNSINQTKINENKNKVIETPLTITQSSIINSNHSENLERSKGFSKRHQKNENINRKTESSIRTKTTEVRKEANLAIISHDESKGKNTRRSAASKCSIESQGNVKKEVKNNSKNNRLNNKRKFSTKTSKAGTEIIDGGEILKVDNDILKASNPKKSRNNSKDVRISQSDDDNFLFKLKRNSHRTGNDKEEEYKECREIVYNLKSFNNKAGSNNKLNKKHNNINNQGHKKKFKKPSNQSSPRRKRLASEKLYYWSSSSDEDFGKINSTCAQEFDGTEQYQKHGWIVGDSHKKLVTLLAITKGSKKVDNCGVKKKICKKKN